MNTIETGSKETISAQKNATELLVRFYILTKSLKIYEPTNAICLEKAQSFFGLLQDMLTEYEGEVAFVIRHNSIFMNRIRLKLGLANYAIFKAMLEEFSKRSIGVITFMTGLTKEELLSFVHIFAGREKKDRKEEFSFSRLMDEIDQAGISHVYLEEAIQEEDFYGGEKSTARIYLLSIVHLKESFERERKQEPIKINTTRRLMQSIYNHMLANESFLLGLTTLKNYHDYTLNHSVNVCALAMALGRRLGLSRSELVELGIAAFFHDLGKIETPVEILNKPDKLDNEEWMVMQKHSCRGAEKLVHLKEFRKLPLRAIHVALEHHMKEDLSGYPKYFARDKLNFFSRIVKVVDHFDALTTERVYRARAFTRAEAINQMLESSGTEFNPVILKTFVNMLGVFPIGSFLSLDTGETAIVVDTNPELKYMMRPRVKLTTEANGNKIDGSIVDLADIDKETGRYKRSIVKALDPAKYGLNVIDYFLAMAAQ